MYVNKILFSELIVENRMHYYLKKKTHKSSRNYLDFVVNKMGNLTEQDMGNLYERYSNGYLYK